MCNCNSLDCFSFLDDYLRGLVTENCTFAIKKESLKTCSISLSIWPLARSTEFWNWKYEQQISPPFCLRIQTWDVIHRNICYRISLAIYVKIRAKLYQTCRRHMPLIDDWVDESPFKKVNYTLSDLTSDAGDAQVYTRSDLTWGAGSLFCLPSFVGGPVGGIALAFCQCWSCGIGTGRVAFVTVVSFVLVLNQKKNQ